MKTFGTLALVLSTLNVGHMAGLFAAFAFAVMPGLGRSSSRMLFGRAPPAWCSMW